MTDSDHFAGARTADVADGRLQVGYGPVRDADADPGEVVWAWVAYEEDPTQGKDRPLVIVGTFGAGRLAGLMLTSRDHGGEDTYHPMGAGAWDRDGRPSWARLDRVLYMDATELRREGAVVPRDAFDRLVEAFRRRHGR